MDDTVKVLKRNRVQCLECNEVLESTYRHHYVSCKCSNQTFTDGGLAYQRFGAKDLTKVKVLSEYVDMTKEELSNLMKQKRLKAEKELTSYIIKHWS